MADTTTITAEKREKIRLARNAYLRAWRQQNPQKVKEQQERYWARRVERDERQEQQEGG